MKSLLLKISAVGLLAILSGCASSVHETVLRPGERITATNRFGTVRITYLSPEKRLYEWDNQRESRTLWTRDERWYGALGLYHPAPALFFIPKVRLVLNEGIKNYRTMEQIDVELIGGSAVMDWVCDNSGLVVGFGREPERGSQINVDVYQYLLNGKKPSRITGARPAQIRRESFDPALTKQYNASKGRKPQDEIPPLINDPFDPYGTEKE